MFGEPDMISPSEYENIVSILHNTGVKAGIDKYSPNGERKWLILENGSAIYTIIKKPIQNVSVLQNVGCQVTARKMLLNTIVFYCTMLS